MIIFNHIYAQHTQIRKKERQNLMMMELSQSRERRHHDCYCIFRKQADNDGNKLEHLRTQTLTRH